MLVVIRTKAEDELATQPVAAAIRGTRIALTPPWRCMEQSQLISLIVGVEPRLPKTRAVVGETQAGAVKTAADQALAELRTVLRELGAEEGAVMP